MSLPWLAREIQGAGTCIVTNAKSLQRHQRFLLCSPEAAAGGISRDVHPTVPGERHGDGIAAVPRLSHSNRCLMISKAWGEPTAKPRPDSRLFFPALRVAPFMLELRCGKLLGRDVCTASDHFNRYSFPWLLLPFKNYLLAR